MNTGNPATTPSNPGNRELIESFRIGVRTRLAARTVSLYAEEVGRFAVWLETDGAHKGDLTAITRRDGERWIGAMFDEGLSKWTIRSRWIACRTFYNWAVDVDEMDESPLAKVTVPKGDSPPPDVLSTEQLAALFTACKGRGFMERRDLALVRLLAATGLRLSEVVGIKVGDLDLVTSTVVVIGKGDRRRVARFDNGTAAVLSAYKVARSKHRLGSSTDALFITQFGPLSAKGVPSILKRRAEQAGIGHVHPHQFRHTFAHRYKNAGGNDSELMTLGGWTSSDVMRRYGASVATERAVSTYDSHNPMEGL